MSSAGHNDDTIRIRKRTVLFSTIVSVLVIGTLSAILSGSLQTGQIAEGASKKPTGCGATNFIPVTGATETTTPIHGNELSFIAGQFTHLDDDTGVKYASETKAIPIIDLAKTTFKGNGQIRCAVVNVSITADYNSLADPVSDCVQNEWNRFIAATKVHEAGHVKIDHDGYKDAHKLLVGLTLVQANQKLDSLSTAVQAMSDLYDDPPPDGTNHGATQGATLDVNACGIICPANQVLLPPDYQIGGPNFVWGSGFQCGDHCVAVTVGQWSTSADPYTDPPASQSPYSLTDCGGCGVTCGYNEFCAWNMFDTASPHCETCLPGGC